jgi:hypothetical protein
LGQLVAKLERGRFHRCVKVRTPRSASPAAPLDANEDLPMTRSPLPHGVLALLLLSRPALAQPPPGDPDVLEADGPPPQPAAAPEAPPSPPPASATAVTATPPPAPATTPAPAPATTPALPQKAPQPPPPPEPLAGFSDGTAFLRSPDSFFQLFPSGRLQVDSYFYKSKLKVPNNSFLIKRARAELTGWIGPMFFFSIAGDFAAGPPAAADPAAPANLISTDVFGALAPFGNKAIVQVGQFDAPFTLENRTSDKYFDFLERSIAVRAFGIPSNKEQGLMVHGMLPQDIVYYSLGVFNGDGQNFRNVDNDFDVMGRAWLSVLPLSLRSTVTLRAGGSFWIGQRKDALPIATQSTPGGLAFWKASGTGPMAIPLELHQDGGLRAFAFELDFNVMHQGGLRGEWVQKNQPAEVADVTRPTAPKVLGHATLDGGAGYLELWYWIIGDDKIIGEPGLQLPSRWKKFGADKPRQGLMVALRLEYLGERVSQDAAAAAAMLTLPMRGKTGLASGTLGVNYWWSKRVRASLDYALFHFNGDATAVTALPARTEQELSMRLGFAL